MRINLGIVCLVLLMYLGSCTSKVMSKAEMGTSTYYRITDSIPNDKDMNTFLAGYKRGKDSIMNRIVGFTIAPLTKAQPDCTMGYFVADAQLWAAQKKDKLVTISVINQNWLRTPYVSSGKLSLGSLFEIMPFENKLEVGELPGYLLDSLCQHIAQNGGWPVSGLSFTIKNKKAIDILVNGNPIHPQHIYRMATSDYLLNGGDNCNFLRSIKRKGHNVFLRDAMLFYLDQLPKKTLDLKLENRIQYAD